MNQKSHNLLALNSNLMGAKSAIPGKLCVLLMSFIWRSFEIHCHEDGLSMKQVTYTPWNATFQSLLQTISNFKSTDMR